MNKNLLSIFLVTLLSMAGMFAVAPALPEIASALSIPSQDIGYLVTSFTLGNILVVAMLGFIADKVGRKRVVIPSLYVFGLASLGCGLVDSFGWLLFWRFVQGMGSAAFGTLSVAMIADLYSGKERVRYFSYNMVVNSIGMTLFPLLGGLLIAYSWRYPFFLGAIALPIAVFTQFNLRYEEKLTEMRAGEYLKQFSRSLRDRRVWLAAFLNFSAFIMLGGAFMTFYALLFSNRFPAEIDLLGTQFSRQVVAGALMSIFSIMVGVVSSQLGPLHSRFGFNRVLAVAFLCYGGSLWLYQLSDELWVVIAAVVWLGAAHGIAIPSIIALFTKIAPEGMTASYVTLNSLVFRFGQTVGPLLMAWIYQYYSLPTVFVIAALVSLPAAWVALTTSWRRADGEY